MSGFIPFQQLYQGLKSNINLYNSLDRIHSNLQSIASTSSSNNQIVFNIVGTLAIESSAAPLWQANTNINPTYISFLLKNVPIGGNITGNINAGSSLIFSYSISALSTTVSSGFGIISAAMPITISISGVGSTYAGSDLTIIIGF